VRNTTPTIRWKDPAEGNSFLPFHLFPEMRPLGGSSRAGALQAFFQPAQSHAPWLSPSPEHRCPIGRSVSQTRGASRRPVRVALIFSTIIAITSPDDMQPRVALITGANRGLGLALTGAFGRAGFHVVATSRSDSGRDAAEEVLAATEGPADRGKRIWCHLDVSQEEDVRKVAKICVAANQGLVVPDVLVHNAGVCLPGRSRNTLRQTFATNFFGPVAMTELLLPHMRPDSTVVFVSSGDGELQMLSSAVQVRLPFPIMHSQRAHGDPFPCRGAAMLHKAPCRPHVLGSYLT